MKIIQLKSFNTKSSNFHQISSTILSSKFTEICHKLLFFINSFTSKTFLMRHAKNIISSIWIMDQFIYNQCHQALHKIKTKVNAIELAIHSKNIRHKNVLENCWSMNVFSLEFYSRHQFWVYLKKGFDDKRRQQKKYRYSWKSTSLHPNRLPLKQNCSIRA